MMKIDYEKLRERLKEDLLKEFGEELAGWPGVAYDCICEAGPFTLRNMAESEGLNLDDFLVRE